MGRFDETETPIKPRHTGAVVIAVVVAVFLVIAPFKCFEYLKASDIMVVQAPWSGILTWHITPGVKWQGFGAVTKYHKRSQLWFSSKPDQGKRENEALRIRFNDGGHANMSGSIAWEMPIDNEHLTAVHTKYGSQEAVESQLVKTVVEKAVYMTGPLMTSQESYAARRPEILQYIEDQVQNGVYQTSVREASTKDVMTGADKTVKITEIAKDKDGNFVRTDKSPLVEFGIRTFNPSLNEIAYDDTVEAQIKQQQAATMQVQTAQAKAREAEQEAITAAKNGEAQAAKAKWEQEVIKAKMVTEAQQKLEVAQLEAKAAEQTKRQQILLGEGEAERRKLVMSADGALEKKLEAWLKSQELWANAIKEFRGNLVPGIVMGSGGGQNAGGNAASLVELLTAKTAKDLALSMDMAGEGATAKK
ncbi:MAG: hypothetical protein IT406_03750 [Candidatus Yanofskybacteria bacterium]|nr:hypothetical protein [Candidatus Yanofskybacteria bacterium]